MLLTVFRKTHQHEQRQIDRAVRAQKTCEREAELIGEAALAYLHEADLYPPIRATLETSWAKERQIKPIAVEINASQGRKATGG